MTTTAALAGTLPFCGQGIGHASIVRQSDASVQTFRYEVELAIPVEEWLRASGASCVAHEVEAGFGVPDLVGGFGSRDTLRRRLSQGPSIRDRLQLQLLDFCSTRKSIEEIRTWAPTGFSTVNRRALKPLIEMGALRLFDDHVSASFSLVSPFEHIVAIELKLSGNIRGIRQAHSYKSFADYAYLAVPRGRVSKILAERVSAHGVGLLAVDRTAAVEIVVEASPTAAIATGRRRFVGERIVDAALDTTRRPGGSTRTMR